ncbi:hypothetical protein KIL84_016002 [Mauremys mutica]|uniref:Uncharacterized protein n=1 Tax=Mauremys mutica TaxID=74926 RepID=A0A9D4ASJ1_9SAUR|nr:hypothetical protein KIL84_016002 [Mauremys mutica]
MKKLYQAGVNCKNIDKGKKTLSLKKNEEGMTFSITVKLKRKSCKVQKWTIVASSPPKPLTLLLNLYPPSMQIGDIYTLAHIIFINDMGCYYTVLYRTVYLCAKLFNYICDVHNCTRSSHSAPIDKSSINSLGLLLIYIPNTCPDSQPRMIMALFTELL